MIFFSVDTYRILISLLLFYILFTTAGKGNNKKGKIRHLNKTLLHHLYPFSVCLITFIKIKSNDNLLADFLLK